MLSTVEPTPPLPQASALRWPTIQALRQIGGSGTIREIEAKVVDIAGFSDAQQSIIHGVGPQTELSYRQAWARTYLKNMGALENRRGSGVWGLTDLGRRVDEATIATGRPRAGRQPPAGASLPHGEFLSDEVAPADANGQGESDNPSPKWQETLLATLLDMSPQAFERLCQRLLRESGFTSVQVTGRSGDGGVDGVGVMRLSLLSFPVLFQCKRYRGSIPPGQVRDFRGAMVGRADKGLFITTGSFTTEARRESSRDGAPPIDLIDGDELCALLKRFKLGVSTRQVEEVTINREWLSAL